MKMYLNLYRVRVVFQCPNGVTHDHEIEVLKPNLDLLLSDPTYSDWFAFRVGNRPVKIQEIKIERSPVYDLGIGKMVLGK